MIRSYFKTAWRNLVRNKIYSGINIFGLAIGMAACFFIFQYVAFESSYDNFNINAPNIYRVALSYSGEFAGAQPSAMNHPALKRDIPEVVDFVRMFNFRTFTESNYLVHQDGDQMKVFYENDMYFVDSTFFKVFSYPLIRGDKEHCLSEQGGIVISESLAKKYFGNQDPLNKILLGNGLVPAKITGVFADVPENSHLKFNVLIPLAPALREWKAEGQWTWPVCYTYVQLAPGADVKQLEAKLPSLIDKYLGDVMKEMNFRSHFHLQPLTDIHLKSHYINEAEVNGDEKEVFFLTVIGVFILLIAWTNYINLSTAKSLERAKEVGIRKVSGARKKQLVMQFLMESLLVNLMALVITIIIITQTMPLFNQLVGKNISAGFFTRGLGSH